MALSLALLLHEPTTVNKTDHSFPQCLVRSRLPVNVADLGVRVTVQSRYPQMTSAKVLLSTHGSAAVNLEPGPFTQETLACRKDIKDGEVEQAMLAFP